jgi:hypothetical protein
LGDIHQCMPRQNISHVSVLIVWQGMCGMDHKNRGITGTFSLDALSPSSECKRGHRCGPYGIRFTLCIPQGRIPKYSNGRLLAWWGQI